MTHNSATRTALRIATELHASAAVELIESQATDGRLSAGVRKLATAEHDLASCRVEDDR